VYQGTESWDNSLVDPDNRRPVDYARLARDLEATGGWGADSLAARYDQAADERAKIWLTARLLHHRAERPDIYASGTYEPLAVEGEKAHHLVAFTRGRLVVLTGRHLWKLAGDWGDTTVELPSGRWRAVIGGTGAAGAGRHRVGDFLGHGPVAVLES
jgi:(1->4)-alpha-D-glucan 1-alpha-D-glucosylmutase